MTETPITIADIATFAAIAGGIFSVLSVLSKAGIEFLTAKFGNKMTVAEQSAQCRFDHKELGGVLAQQNANITKLYQQNVEQMRQNGEQIKALSDANHAAQLRHEIVLNSLKENKTEITSKHP